jgi:hypothetical protein
LTSEYHYPNSMNKGRCFQCEAQNPPEQSFCGQCGAALLLRDYIAAQVTKAVAESPRDREVLIKAEAVEVFEKAWGWAKLTAEILLIPVIAVVTLLGWFGWREFNLSKAAANAQQQIEGAAKKASDDINKVSAKSIGDVQTESGKANEASRNSEQTAAKLSADLNRTVSTTKTELNNEASDVRTEVAKSKTELQEVHKLQPEFDTMRGQLTRATSDLTAQQKVISSSEDFIKHVFGSHISYLYSFPDFIQPNHAIIIPAPKGVKNSTVLMLAPSTPVEGTIQLQWGIFLQQPNTYLQFHNLIVFFWGDPPDELKNNNIAISFFADSGDKKLFKRLDFKDGRAYVDDQPLPKFFQPDPDFTGKQFPEPKE